MRSGIFHFGLSCESSCWLILLIVFSVSAKFFSALQDDQTRYFLLITPGMGLVSWWRLIAVATRIRTRGSLGGISAKGGRSHLRNSVVRILGRLGFSIILFKTGWFLFSVICVFNQNISHGLKILQNRLTKSKELLLPTCLKTKAPHCGAFVHPE